MHRMLDLSMLGSFNGCLDPYSKLTARTMDFYPGFRQLQYPIKLLFKQLGSPVSQDEQVPPFEHCLFVHRKGLTQHPRKLRPSCQSKDLQKLKPNIGRFRRLPWRSICRHIRIEPYHCSCRLMINHSPCWWDGSSPGNTRFRV